MRVVRSHLGAIATFAVVTALATQAHAGAGCITLDPPDKSMLPDATVGVPYSFTLSASGGASGQYFWQLTASPPPGLQVSNGFIANGQVTGTPTQSTGGGYGSFTMAVYDAKDFNCYSGGEWFVRVLDPSDAGASDASVDTSTDAPIDVSSDAIDDTVTEASNDATTDVAPDVPNDVSADASPDVSEDAPASDAPTDVAPSDDAATDVGPDALACAAAFESCPPSCCPGLQCQNGLCCGPEGTACQADHDCCDQGSCVLGHCTAPVPCQPSGASCETTGECCYGVCEFERCCLPDGATTQKESDCCSGYANQPGGPVSPFVCAIPPGPQVVNDQGCSCTMAGRSTSDAPALLLVAAAGIAFGRRRRRSAR